MTANGQSYVFRALVLSTLLIVSAIFAVGPYEKVGSPDTNNKTASEAKDVGPPKTFSAKLLDDPTAFFTMALAALTAVLAGTAAIQIYYLRRTDGTARLSAKAAEKAALAAEKSALVAEAALLGVEAPFIFVTVKKWREGDPLAPGNRPGFAAITLHNHGRSPAIVRDFYPGTIRCVGLPEPIGYPPPHSLLHRDEVIPAGKASGPWRFHRDAFCAPDDLDRLLNSDATYWIVGQIRYADAFGAQYVTGFCFALNVFGDKFYGFGGSRYNYRRRLSEEETREAEARDAELPGYLTPPPERS